MPYTGVQFVAIPEFQAIGTTVGQAVAAALSGQQTVDQALQGAQEHDPADHAAGRLHPVAKVPGGPPRDAQSLPASGEGLTRARSARPGQPATGNLTRPAGARHAMTATVATELPTAVPRQEPTRRQDGAARSPRRSASS